MTAERDRFDRLVRDASGQVLAALIANLGDFDLAEEALAEAWLLAAERWPTSGFPDRPEAWLFTVARRKAIDRLRRERTRSDRQRAAHQSMSMRADDAERDAEERWRSGVDDDRLRLIFTCCHPALAPEAQVALTLRAVGGLTTDEIARAFLVPEATMGQRIVRAKRKIRLAAIPYRVPDGHELPDRLGAVLRVLYLVFNEAYLATSGDDPIRGELADEAIRISRILVELMPDEPEAAGLLALMILHHARRDERVDAAGDLVLLEDQDRAGWYLDEISEGTVLLERALRRRQPGPYQLQAAIAAVHDSAITFDDTDWVQIEALYGSLASIAPSAVVSMNRAVAVSFVDGPAAGLALLDTIELPGSHLLPAARADLLRRLGRQSEAAIGYRVALGMATNPAEQRYLRQRLATCEA